MPAQAGCCLGARRSQGTQGTHLAPAEPPADVLNMCWLQDPWYAAGSWVPELIRLANGQDVLGKVQQAVQFTAEELAGGLQAPAPSSLF